MISLSTLIKADTVSIAVAATLVLLLDDRHRALRDRMSRIAWLGAGVCLPLLVTIAAYAAFGHLGVLRATFLDASYAYVAAPSTGGRWFIVWQILMGLASRWALLGLLPLAGVVLLALQGGEARRRAAILVGAFTALLGGLVVAGRGFDHYLIVEVPVVGVASGALFHALWRFYTGLTVSMCLALTVIAPIGDLARQYVTVLHDPAGALRKDHGRRLARYLTDHGAAGHYVFLNRLHVAAWLSRAKLPSRYVHPTVLRRPQLLRALDGPSASVAAELRSILVKRPVFLVLEARTFWLPTTGDAETTYRRTLREAVRTDYVLDEAISDVLIFRRADLPPAGPVPDAA